MTAGQKKRLLGGIKKTKAMWEKWYEAILEEEKLQDIRIQCVDFCEATTSKVHAVLQHAPCDLRGGTFRQHPRVLVATVDYQEKPHLCMQILHAAVFQVSRGAYILLRLLSVTENQTQWLLDEIQRQPSVYVLSGLATVITNITAASALLADEWSTESVSRVVRTTRTRRENHEREHAEHVSYSHTHDGVTISDAFPVTGQGFNGGKHPAENTTRQDDLEDETEQPLSDSLQARRQISRVHENMGHTSNRNLCSRIFAEKVESDGNRREVTPLEAPRRSDKTERAGRDCKEDYYKMTQDGSQASTRKVFEEDRVTVNQTKASLNNDSRYSEYHSVRGKNPLQVEDAVLECGGEGISMMSWQQTGGLAAHLALGQQRRSKRALYYAAKHYKGRLPVGRPLGLGDPFTTMTRRHTDTSRNT